MRRCAEEHAPRGGILRPAHRRSRTRIRVAFFFLFLFWSTTADDGSGMISGY